MGDKVEVCWAAIVGLRAIQASFAGESRTLMDCDEKRQLQWELEKGYGQLIVLTNSTDS